MMLGPLPLELCVSSYSRGAGWKWRRSIHLPPSDTTDTSVNRTPFAHGSQGGERKHGKCSDRDITTVGTMLDAFKVAC